MPLTVFAIKGIPGNRRERIEAAIVAGGKHVSGAHEAWIAADPFRGGLRVLITGPHESGGQWRLRSTMIRLRIGRRCPRVFALSR